MKTQEKARYDKYKEAQVYLESNNGIDKIKKTGKKEHLTREKEREKRTIKYEQRNTHLKDKTWTRKNKSRKIILRHEQKKR